MPGDRREHRKFFVGFLEGILRHLEVIDIHEHRKEIERDALFIAEEADGLADPDLRPILPDQLHIAFIQIDRTAFEILSAV